MRKFNQFALSGMLVLAITGCASTGERLMEEGAVPLSQDELAVLLVNRTEQWTKGGGYYGEDGTLEAVWKGESVTGTWEITDTAGEVCTQVDSWGSSPFCTIYYNKDGERIAVSNDGREFSKPDDHYSDGNTLDSL